MNQNMLKLNAEKTEMIVFSPKKHLSQVADLSIKVGTSEVESKTTVRNLGAFLDSQMNMESHINNVCRSCYTQLRQISHIRGYLNMNTTKTLVNSLVTSRLDYCNSLLFGLPKKSLNKLQLVQHTSARIITRTKRHHHITPILKELHWIPVEHRINFEILTFTFKALNGQSPGYVRSLLEIYVPKRDLRSGSNAMTLVVPKSRTKTYGDRSFMVAAPTLWNSLPSFIRSSTTLASFKKQLKTHLFLKVYEE